MQHVIVVLANGTLLLGIYSLSARRTAVKTLAFLIFQSPLVWNFHDIPTYAVSGGGRSKARY
jgi:hypothetical protein